MDSYLSTILACPVCKHGVHTDGDELVCLAAACAARYPMINGRPILINEANSLFRMDDYRERGGVTTMDLRSLEDIPLGARLKRIVRSLLPSKSISMTDFSAEDALRYIGERKPYARVLVIGAGDAAFACQSESQMEIVYSDVALGPLTDLVADAHDLPFQGNTFDAVVAVAVLEHVLDPPRVVAEITRALKPDGFIYSVAPFMQQVHMGCYDFQRFSERAHRWLWRDYDEVKSGVANGNGMAVVWATEYFLRQYPGLSLLTVPVRILLQPLLWADRAFGPRRATFDGASAFYFLGSRSARPLEMRTLVAGYRGQQR